MKRLYYYISKVVFSLAFLMATVSVNTTCNRRFYQEKMDDQLNMLRKY